MGDVRRRRRRRSLEEENEEENKDKEKENEGDEVKEDGWLVWFIRVYPQGPRKGTLSG